MSLKCFYHPEREAQSKCEKCGKLICLECKKSFIIRRGSSYSTKQEYCQVCYFKQQALLIYKIGFMLFMFLVMALIMMMITFSNFLIPFLFVLIIAFIFIIIYCAKKRAKIISQKENFIRGIKSSSVKKDVVFPTCKKCGKKIESNILICPYCGCDIKD